MLKHDGAKVRPKTADWQPKYSMVASRSRRRAAFGYKRQKMENKKPLPEQKFRTKSSHIKAILNEFITCYPIKGTILHGLEVKINEYEYDVVQLDLMLRRYREQGCIGTVKITPINDDEVLIGVSRTSGPTLWEEEQEEIYTEAWKFLRAFWKHMQNIFSGDQIEEVDVEQSEEMPLEERAAVDIRKKAKHLGVRVIRLQRWDRLIKYKGQLLTINF